MCHNETPVDDEDLDGIDETFVRVPVEGGPLYASLFRPRAASLGNVLVISDIFGRSPFYRSLGKRLAASGFVALVPEIFSRLWPVADGDDQSGLERLRRLDQRVTLDDLDHCRRYLVEATQTESVGAVGFCVGGNLTMLLSTRPGLAAGVVYYGITERRPVTEFAPYTVLDELPTIRAPLLGFWGEKDSRVSIASVNEADATLTAHGKEHEFIVYPGLHHSFLTFDKQNPGHSESIESWDKSTAFLKLHLTSYRTTVLS